MPAMQRNATKCKTLGLIAVSLFAATGRGDPVGDRLDSIERRLVAIEQIVIPPPPNPTPGPTTSPVSPTQPVTQPTQNVTPVRADTAQAMRIAIASGATWIQTTGIDLNTDLDARGATIELLPGGPGWKPAIALGGDAVLSNAILKTPPSKFNESGQRVSFNKAITTSGRNMTLRNVTFAPDIGFCIHHQQGTLQLESVKASTFSEYFVYQEPDTFASAKWCEVKGGSKAESVWRVTHANYLIEDSNLDNSAGGKAVLRGDSPGKVNEPGGVARRTKFVGQVGPNPLTEDDGGQMFGIDRWRFAEGWIYQLPHTRKNETIAFARQMYVAGATPQEIVRAAADKFIDPDQFAKVAKGKRKLSDHDIKLTLDLRAKEVGRHSRFLIEDCEIVGDLRLNARMTGMIRRTRITGNPCIAGNTQSTYPFPVDRVIVGGEQQPAPDVTFDGVEFKGGQSIGIEPKAWPSLKFINGTRHESRVIESVSMRLPLNASEFAIEGTQRVFVEGGLRYRDSRGAEQSAWVGGYWGPGGTPLNPAGLDRRWREFDETKLRAFARSITTPIFVLDVEHWEMEPRAHDAETTRKWIGRLAEMVRIIKQERPDVVVGCYDVVPVPDFWSLVNFAQWIRWKETGEKTNMNADAWWAGRETEMRSAFEAWQRANDHAAEILLPHVDALFPNIYPHYRMTGGAFPIKGTHQMDADAARLRIAEARRLIAKWSPERTIPIYPLYLPAVEEDGGELVSQERARAAIDAAYAAGATDVILWSAGRPREIIEETLETIRNSAERSRPTDR